MLSHGPAMLDEYRSEYTAFNIELSREQYLYLAGLKASLDLTPIYDRYSDLFTRDSISQLKELLDATAVHFETERVSINRLLRFATEQYLENRSKLVAVQLSEREAGVLIDHEGKRLTLHDVGAAMMTEDRREVRRELYTRRAEAIEETNALRAERLAALHATARELGHENYAGMYKSFGVDVDRWADNAVEILEATESRYIRRLDESLRNYLAIRVEDAERFDLPFFLKLSPRDERFPAESLERVYRQTLAGIGVDVDSQKNVLIDTEPRPRKSARAFCVPIVIPDEIKLVIRLNGGQSDYQSLFHEGGHAQHFAWTNAALRPELRYTGDYALSETYAFLFHHLIGEAPWLERFLDFHDNREFRRLFLLTRLATIRRYAAKLVYEKQLHSSGDLVSARLHYAESQTAATRFRTGDSEFLFDLDDGLYSASYLRAWCFEVALRDHLKTRFGEQWWTSEKAGGLLKEMWETGNRYSAEEMASQLGSGPITHDALVDEYLRELKSD